MTMLTKLELQTAYKAVTEENSSSKGAEYDDNDVFDIDTDYTILSEDNLYDNY